MIPFFLQLPTAGINLNDIRKMPVQSRSGDHSRSLTQKISLSSRKSAPTPERSIEQSRRTSSDHQVTFVGDQVWTTLPYVLLIKSITYLITWHSVPELSKRDFISMERGSGRGARKWAVELHDAANTSSSRDIPPDPLGFSRSTVDPEETTSGKQKKENEASWKQQKAWEAAQAPVKNLMMMGFMMWMAGSTVHLFSIGITFSALWQPVSALQSIGKVFEPFQDSKTNTFLPKVAFVALNLAAMGLGLWKLNSLGLLPTHASDWLSNLAPPQSVEFSGGGLPLPL